MRDRVPLFGGLALLAIAFVIGAIAIGHGIRDGNRDDVIVVTDSAKKRITSDYVIWACQSERDLRRRLGEAQAGQDEHGLLRDGDARCAVRVTLDPLGRTA
jgi:hypothetical protein